MTRVVISQPMYFPWVGFIAQMSLADVMIWLDDARFSKGSFSNRVQVKTAGGTKWMTIPLVNKGHNTDLKDLQSTDPSYAERHASLLRNALGTAPHWSDARDVFETATGHDALVDDLIDSAERLADSIGLPHRKTLRSSSMDVPGSGSRRVLDLVRAADGATYITGHGARNYLDHEAFEAEDVAVEYMAYAPAPWPQQHGPFTPYVTALDLVAHVPKEDRASHLEPATVGWRDFLARQQG